jgi:hypothetical protein
MLTNVGNGKFSSAAFIVHEGHANLVEIVRALGSPRCFAGSLHGGQEKRDEHADDRNDH